MLIGLPDLRGTLKGPHFAIVATERLVGLSVDTDQLFNLQPIGTAGTTR